jgi:hypothetical protein
MEFSCPAGRGDDVLQQIGIDTWSTHLAAALEALIRLETLSAKLLRREQGRPELSEEALMELEVPEDETHSQGRGRGPLDQDSPRRERKRAVGAQRPARKGLRWLTRMSVNAARNNRTGATKAARNSRGS